MPLPLTTERLRLRPATLDDLDAWLAISRDAETAWWGEPSSTLEDSEEIEVGYRFLREHWGRGYATEAARAAIRFAFDEMGLDRLVAVTLPTNRASRRVMEKCGLSFVGVMQVYGRAQVKYAATR